MALTSPFLMNVLQKIKQHTVFEALLILVLVTLPLGSYALNSCAIILFFLASLYHFVTNKKHFYVNNISLLFISFYILCLFSLIWTEDIGNTQAGLIRFLSYLIIPLSFMLSNSKQLNGHKIVGIFSKALVFYAVYCLLFAGINAFNNSDIAYFFYHKLSNNLGALNAIYLSVFVSLGVSFFLTKKNKSKLDLYSLFILSLFLILLSSKIIISVTFTTTLFYVIRKRKRIATNLKSVLLILGVLIIFIVASSNLFKRVEVEVQKTKIHEVLNKENFGHVYLWTGFGLRIFQVKAFVEISQAQEKIILGTGLNNSQTSLNNKYKEYNFYPGFLNYNYHNQYVQVFAELGFVGFCIFVFIFVLILKEAIVNRNYFLASFIILLLVVCITESFLWRQRGMVFFITISLLLTKKNKYTF